MVKVNSAQELAKTIDHTNLSNLATKEDIAHLTRKAKEYGFYAVVVSPYYVEYAKNLLENSPIKVATVAGFPLGFTSPKLKKKEAKIAVKSGTDELDMVANIQALKAKDYDTIAKELEMVRKVTENKVFKVIIEAELLNDEEIVKISEIIMESGADYLKTSTGMSGQSPTASNIALIRKTVPQMKIKASGGIKDYKTVLRLLSMGVNRIGTSSGDLILEEYKRMAKQQTHHETK